MIPAKDFMKFDKDRKETSNKCIGCDCLLSQDISGEHDTIHGVMCDDCYFDEVGQMIMIAGGGIGGHFSRFN